MKVLEVKGVKTYYLTDEGQVKAVDGVSFAMERGETLGLAGESGCGKTTLALTITRLLPRNARVISGEIYFDGVEILSLDEEEFRKIRWKDISIIFQEAMNALNPVRRVGDQIVEAILLHENVAREEAVDRVMNALEMVGIDRERFWHYPHEFSGGMRQRALIAMALVCNPKLVIADEPVTALDVMVRAQVLKLIKELQSKMELSMILITHDLSVIAETCDRVAIMYAGKIVEIGDVISIFKDPKHPYTKGLIKAFPSIYGPRELPASISGTPPDLLNPPSGCRFHPRCPHVMDICKVEEPEMKRINGKRYVACHLY
ncbi:MAG: ABC transporter ATP-binding protein [Candidatus Baldrarchaeia archaeon]